MPKIKKVIILDAGGVIHPDSGFDLYPGAPELINALYKAGYQVVICINNADLGVENTRRLLAEEGLACVKVYGSAELHVSKPHPDMFLKVCELEKVDPDECWFIDDREENQMTAATLGMGVIPFERPISLTSAAQSINNCREKLVALRILKTPDLMMIEGLDRGKYPGLFGLNKENRVVKYNPSDRRYIVTDMPNEDDNQRKRCLYESRLARLIVENSREYWEQGYHKINQLFLADFDLKSNSAREPVYQAYFLAQPWLTCGPPQLRGRQARAQPAESKTWGDIKR